MAKLLLCSRRHTFISVLNNEWNREFILILVMQLTPDVRFPVLKNVYFMWNSKTDLIMSLIWKKIKNPNLYSTHVNKCLIKKFRPLILTLQFITAEKWMGVLFIATICLSLIAEYKC